MAAPGPLGRPLTPAEQARNRIAAAVRRGDPPEVITRLRAELEQTRIDRHLAEIDAAGRAGQLTAAQREVISRLFSYGPAPDAEPEQAVAS